MLIKKKVIILGILFFVVLTSFLCWTFRDKIRNKLFDKKAKIDLTFVESVESMTSPTFPDNVCEVSNYGAVTIDSEIENQNVESFKKAIEDCSNKGGGIVKVPKGEWLLNGPIHLKSNINLSLEEETIITFSSNPTDYLPVVKSRYEGNDLMNFSPMIYMPDCNNVAITGKGTIRKIDEPNGWFEFNEKKKEAEGRLYEMTIKDVDVDSRVFGKDNDYLKPSFIQPYNSKNVLIEGITVKDGPMWTIHPVYVENLIIRGVSVQTGDQNTDGIVIDSSRNVLVEDNNITSGDDAIAIKSGKDKDGWKVGKPSQNIVIRNNVVEESHGAFTIGSEMSGDVKDVLIKNLVVKESNNGFRIKTRPGRGGVIENILVESVFIHSANKQAMRIDFDYGGDGEESSTIKEPEMRNVEFCDIEIGQNQKDEVISFIGLGDRTENILFKNIRLTDKEVIKTVKLKNARNITFENVDIPLFETEKSLNIKIINGECPNLAEKKSEVFMECEE